MSTLLASSLETIEREYKIDVSTITKNTQRTYESQQELKQDENLYVGMIITLLDNDKQGSTQYLVVDGSDERSSLDTSIKLFDNIYIVVISVVSNNDGRFLTCVNVKSYGAKGDGKTDDTAAKDLALEASRRLKLPLYFPEGEYILKTGVYLRENETLIGSGSPTTKLKLSDDASSNENLICNEAVWDQSNNNTSTSHINVSGFELDGNVQRLADKKIVTPYSAMTLQPREEWYLTISVDGLAVNGRIGAEMESRRQDISVRVDCKEAGKAVIRLTNVTDVKIDLDAGNIICYTYSYSFSGGATRGTGIGFGGVSYVNVDDIHTHDWAKHAMSVDAKSYDTGDGTTSESYPQNPSRVVNIQNCIFGRSGDDCFTTHGVELCKVTNCHSYDPQGTYIPTNTNCYEIDDNSRTCILNGVTGHGGSSGIQIKAHPTHPAASTTILQNFIFDHNDAGVDIHHTNHGDAGQEVSPTGRSILIQNGFVRYSNDTTLRSLSYHYVAFENIECIDDGRLSGKPFSLENGTQDVYVNNVRFHGFTNSKYILWIQASTTTRINIQNSFFEGGKYYGAYIGSGVKGVTMKNVHFSTNPDIIDTTRSEGNPAVYSYNTPDYSGNSFENVTYDGWLSQFRFSSVNYKGLSLVTPESINTSGSFNVVKKDDSIPLDISRTGGHHLRIGSTYDPVDNNSESTTITEVKITDNHRIFMSTTSGASEPEGVSLPLINVANIIINGSLSVFRRNDTSGPLRAYYARSRSEEVNGTKALVLNDSILDISSIGDDGESDFTNNGGVRSAAIITRVDGDVSKGIVPTRIDFGTMNQQGDITIRWQMLNDGTLIPAIDNTYTIGNESSRLKSIYSAEGVIQTSDENYKQDIQSLDEKEVSTAKACTKLVKKFRFKQSVEEKGTDARCHIGMIAQEVIQAFKDNGLDPFDYGIVCYDKWDAKEAVYDEDEEGNKTEVKPAIEAGERYSLRYDELSMFCLAALS